MRFPFGVMSAIALASPNVRSMAVGASGASFMETRHHQPEVFRPKIFIISHFTPEALVWYDDPDLGLLARNITVPGFSPLFPDAHCNTQYTVCQVTTGEAEINAAVTIASLVASPQFDLHHTYFLISGIAGGNPERTTIGGVAFARYAVQVALQYEVDVRELPDNFSTGYWAQGSTGIGQYPAAIYGTEAFELNVALRDRATDFASAAQLNDSTSAAAYRSKYVVPGNDTFAAAAATPYVTKCDVATSDTYYSGAIISNAFDQYSKLITNGTAEYCATAQEDNATLEALLRGAKVGKVDFARIILMRTISDFDRAYPGQSTLENLLYSTSDAFPLAIANIYTAGIEVVRGILANWEDEFRRGVDAKNYIGDIFGTLGGDPDFGPGAMTFAGFFRRRSKEVMWRRGLGRP